MAKINCTVTKSSLYEMYIEYSVTQDAIKAESYISHALKLKQLTNDGDFNGNMNVTYKVAGESFTYNANYNIDNKGNKGSVFTIKSGKTTVAHNKTTGVGSFTVSCSGSCYSGGYGPGDISLSQQTIALTTIDRKAPTVSHNVSNVTSDGLAISVVSSVESDIFEYSIDGGTNYVVMSTTAGTSANVTLTGISPNSELTIKCRARRKYNQVYGYSTTTSVKTLGQSVLTKATTFTADASTVVFTFVCLVYDTSFYHTLHLIDGDSSVLLSSFTSTTLGEVSKTLSFASTSTVRTNVLKMMSNSKAKKMTLRLTTYTNSSKSVQVGSATEMKINVETSAALSAPTFTTFSYRDIDPATVNNVTNNDQLLVQLRSKIRVTFNKGVAKNQATIDSYSVTIADKTVTSQASTENDFIIDVGSVNKSGTFNLTITCIDSRGYSTSLTKRVTVLPYEVPKVTEFEVKRRNGTDEIVSMIIKGKYSEVMYQDEALNTLESLDYSFKNTETNTSGSFVSVLSKTTIGNGSFSVEITQLEGKFDKKSNFEFTVYAIDTFNAMSTETTLLRTSIPAISIRKKDATHDFRRVGINNNSPEFALDIGADDESKAFGINGTAMVDFVVEQDKTEDGWEYRKWKDGRAECWMRYPYSIDTEDYFDSGTGWYTYELQEVAFPTGLFLEDSEPVLMLTNDGSSIFMNQAYFVGHSSFSVLMSSIFALPVDNELHLYAIGRWK